MLPAAAGKFLGAAQTGLSIASMFGGGEKEDPTAANQALSNWFSGRNEYDNKGASLKISEAGRRVGLSRADSTRYRNQLEYIGLTFEDMAKLQMEAASKITGGFAKGGESTARTAGRAVEQTLGMKKAKLYANLADLGEQDAVYRQGILREYQSMIGWHEGKPAYHKIPKRKGPGLLAQLSGGLNKFSSTYSAFGKLGESLEGNPLIGIKGTA